MIRNEVNIVCSVCEKPFTETDYMLKSVYDLRNVCRNHRHLAEVLNLEHYKKINGGYHIPGFKLRFICWLKNKLNGVIVFGHRELEMERHRLMRMNNEP